MSRSSSEIRGALYADIEYGRTAPDYSPAHCLCHLGQPRKPLVLWGSLGVKPLFYTLRWAFGVRLQMKPCLDIRRYTTRMRKPARTVCNGPARTPGNGVFQGIREICRGTCHLHRDGFEDAALGAGQIRIRTAMRRRWKRFRSRRDAIRRQMVSMCRYAAFFRRARFRIITAVASD
jgi:hypothetical protein